MFIKAFTFCCCELLLDGRSTAGLRMVYGWSTDGLRMVYGRSMAGLRPVFPRG
ncbi:hypothetical protein PAMP_011658 [Pampus punctatissimus]